MPAPFQPDSLADLSVAFTRVAAGESLWLAFPDESAPPTALPPSPEPHLGVRSSGSTGLPKTVWCPWSRLLAEVRLDPRTSRWTWMSPFHPTSFAGVQVALQAWRGGGQAESLPPDWTAAWLALAQQQADALSATPTYLDLLLQNEPPNLPPNPVHHFTLGGEVLRPALGERLRQRFPQATFTVVYASAEFGVLLKTRRLDGWYETESLAQRHPHWRVQDGRLELAAHPDAAWQSTGDTVEVREGLIRVIGRADRVANVAGSKVSLDEVARLAEEVPGVRRAQAVAAANPVTGQVVCLRFAPEPGSDPAAVRDRLEIHLRATLPKPAWPRQWDLDPLLPARNAKRSLAPIPHPATSLSESLPPQSSQ